MSVNADIFGKPGSQFLGTWVKVSGNGSRTITIEDNGDQFLVTEESQKSGAVYKDGFMMLGDTIAITYIKTSDHIVLPEVQGGGEYARQSPAVALVNQAVSDNNGGHWDQAITDSTAALKIDPNSAGGYAQRGKAYLEKKDYDDAIADYTADLKLVPTATYSYVDRAHAYCGKGDYDSAIADYDKAIETAPKDDFLHRFYDEQGDLYQEKGDFENAVADYTKSLQLMPNSADSRVSLSLTLRRLHRDDTVAGLQDQLKQWPNGVWGQTVDRYLTGDLSEKDFMTASTLGPFPGNIPIQQIDAYYYAGMIHLINGDNARAKELFSKCVDSIPKDSVDYTTKKIGDLAKAELTRLSAPK